MLTTQYFTKSLKKSSSIFYSARYLEQLSPLAHSGNSTTSDIFQQTLPFRFESAPPTLEPTSVRKPSKMSSNNIKSSAYKLIENLSKTYQPKFYQGSQESIWHKVPSRRRSSVMVLLFEGSNGELRVILTKRSRQLRSFSGHISFPGGRADDEKETEFEVARRETEEEIGLSRSNETLMSQYGCTIDEITTLPSYLARTFLVVSPCIGFINWHDSTQNRRLHQLSLNPGESSSIFSVPLIDFLKPTGDGNLNECLKQSHIKTKWGGIPWNLRSYIFPMHNENEIDWLQEIDDLSSPSENELDETPDDHEFDVRTRNCWGLTANILHDIAKIVYNNNNPESLMGEEDLIHSLYQNGQVQTPVRTIFEKRLINNIKGCSYGEVLPNEEFQRLKALYKDIN